MFSQLFVQSSRGDVLVFRDYRGDVDKETPDIFFSYVQKWKDEKGSHPPPIIVRCMSPADCHVMFTPESRQDALPVHTKEQFVFRGCDQIQHSTRLRIGAVGKNSPAV
jgi:hypothetical protein